MSTALRRSWFALGALVVLACGEDEGSAGGVGAQGGADAAVPDATADGSGATDAAGGTGGMGGTGGTGGVAGTGGSAGTGGTSPACDDPDQDGYGEGPGCLGADCAPSDGEVHPGAAEVCNGVDDDCNGQLDDGVTCGNPTLWVFVLAGQSNMVGLGFNDELSSMQEGSVDRAVIYYNDSVHPNTNTMQWMQLAPGFGVTEDRFGPELTFGRRVRELWPDRDIAVIKVAEGGTALHDRWKAGTGDLYQLLVAEVGAQMQALSQQWRPQIVGFVWMQGESDAIQQPTADAYGGNYAEFLWALRTDLGVTLMPATAGLISPAGGWPFADTVRNATTLVSTLVGQTDVVETIDLPTQPADIYHYASDSYVTLGQRFAEAAVAQVPLDWHFATDLGQAQGDGFWVCFERAGGTSELLTWDGAQSRYTNADGSVLIGPGWMHPGASSAAELAWWAPYAGNATVTLTASDADATGGDGVQVEAAVNGAVVWGPVDVPNGGSAQHTFKVDLAQGNMLAFRTSSGVAQDPTYDATAWTVDIAMSPQFP